MQCAGLFRLFSPGKASSHSAALPSGFLCVSLCAVFSFFRNPPNSDKDFRIFNVRTFLCVRIHTGIYYYYYYYYHYYYYIIIIIITMYFNYSSRDLDPQAYNATCLSALYLLIYSCLHLPAKNMFARVMFTINQVCTSLERTSHR